MVDHSEIHREHIIIPSASGPSQIGGPLAAFYTVWKPEGNNSYRAVLQGTLSGVFTTLENAYAAALTEAKEKLDHILGAE